MGKLSRVAHALLDHTGIPGVGGGGASAVIAQQVLSADAASISFTGIPADYESLQLLVHGRITGGVSVGYVAMRFNNDSGASYDTEWARLDASTFTGFNVAQDTVARIGQLPGTGATANMPGTAEATIIGYARTVFYKGYVARSAQLYGESTNKRIEVLGGHWRSTAAINRVDLVPEVGNFLAGTVATLYGIAGA